MFYVAKDSRLGLRLKLPVGHLPKHTPRARIKWFRSEINKIKINIQIKVTFCGKR